MNCKKTIMNRIWKLLLLPSEYEYMLKMQGDIN